MLNSLKISYKTLISIFGFNLNEKAKKDYEYWNKNFFCFDIVWNTAYVLIHNYESGLHIIWFRN